MRKLVEDRIKELFAVVLKEQPAAITDETRPATLARWDSLQHLILVSSFEEELGVDIDPAEIAEMFQSFGAFKRIILEKLARAGRQ
jgi:acyl carrier protein